MKYKISTLKNLFKSIKNGATIKDACAAAGISHMAFYKWCRKPQFKEHIEMLKESRISFVEDALYKNALNGKESSQQFFLKNKASWQDKRNIDHTGLPDMRPIVNVILSPNGKSKYEKDRANRQTEAVE